jgi:hypothetical protein
LLVEHLARVAQAGDMDACLFELIRSPRQVLYRLTGFVFLAMAANSAHQIEHVEFNAGMMQQMNEVPEPFGVL